MSQRPETVRAPADTATDDVAERPRRARDDAPQGDESVGSDRDDADGSALKRLLDVVLASGGMVATLPFWILVPLAIKLEDGGPVFFPQLRIGRDGETFEALKFRSMVPPDSGRRTPQQAQPDAELVTRVGRVLRATALDELPQFLNILRGDMSFVGPRSVPPREKAGGSDGKTVDVTELPGFDERHAVRPGLTGLAQVYLPRSASHREKFRYDLVYVRSRTLWLDLKLIAVSIWISVRGKWPEVGNDR